MSRKILQGGKLSTKAIISFCISLVLCAMLLVVSIQMRSNYEKITMEQIVLEKSIIIHDIISKLLYKTQVLSAFIAHDSQDFSDFNQIVNTLVDDPAILNVLIAPQGVVSYVYPMAGNEQVIGLDMLSEGAGNKEAILAKETRELVFGGPFELVQGGQALVGRLPVFFKNAEGVDEFWGIVSITLKYPQVLDGAGLSAVEMQGYFYEVWRISPDTNARQTISASEEAHNPRLRYVEKEISLFSALWHFRISPLREWFQYPETWMLVFASLCISFLIAFLTQNNVQLRLVQGELEAMMNSDSLTNLLNRKGLFSRLDELLNSKTLFLLYYLDINKFKQINDTYGHSFGDLALTEMSRKFLKHMDSSYVFARIGGDEFVLLHVLSATSDLSLEAFWKEIYAEFELPVYTSGGGAIQLTFSKGVAKFPSDGTTVDTLMAHADSEMYANKPKNRRHTDT